MGMFTCLRFIGVLKEEYEDEIRKLFDGWNGGQVEGEGWKEFANNHPFAKYFSELPRCDFIPFGSMSHYNRDKFNSVGNIDNISFSNIIEGRTWVFQCDLKDYDNEIDVFLVEVATKICVKFIAEKWCEECDFPELLTYGLG